MLLESVQSSMSCCTFILSYTSKRHLLLRCSSQTSIPEMVEQIMWNVVGKEQDTRKQRGNVRREKLKKASCVKIRAYNSMSNLLDDHMKSTKSFKIKPLPKNNNPNTMSDFFFFMFIFLLSDHLILTPWVISWAPAQRVSLTWEWNSIIECLPQYTFYDLFDKCC